MPNDQDVSNVNSKPDSTLKTWNRLEVRPRSEDFERSLKAEVRDPLWMLCRQWQWGEFKGEDTGSAVYAKVHKVTRQMTRLALGGDAAVSYNDTMDSIPLEARVEQLAVPQDTGMGLKIGQRWRKLIKSKGLDPGYYNPQFVATYPFVIPTLTNTAQDATEAEFYSNRESWQAHLAAIDRTMDGRKLVAYLSVSGQYASDGISLENSGDDALLDAAGNELLAWLQGIYLQPSTGTNPAWSESNMEYQVGVSIPQEEPGGSPVPPTVLVAKEYYQGHLDWYSFDIASDGTAVDPSLTANSTVGESVVVTEEKSTVIPTGISFAGMPNERWWEFENYRINQSDLNATTTDIAKIMVTEFAMVYAHEWSIVPYRVPVGSLNEIKSIVVTDTFGQKIMVEPAGKGDQQDWQRWNMYNLHVADATDGLTADHRLFIPPTIPRIQESDPLEEVHFIRDEVSNMVWGIEAVVPNDLGGGKNGYDAASEYVRYLKSVADDPDESLLQDGLPALDDVNVRYHLSSTVPENWIPFIPVKVDQNIFDDSYREIQLQRGTIPRDIPRLALPAGMEYVRPKTALLTPPDSNFNTPLYIFEEEVPRSGTHVTTGFQRARWYDGETFLWMGRRKSTGRGEGSSGLIYDVLSAPLKGEE